MREADEKAYMKKDGFSCESRLFVPRRRDDAYWTGALRCAIARRRRGRGNGCDRHCNVCHRGIECIALLARYTKRPARFQFVVGQVALYMS